MKYIFFIVIFGVLFGWILSIGLEKQARVECNTWQRQEKEYPAFYLLEWQARQCEDIGINIDAPVFVKFEDGSTKTFSSLEDLNDWKE